MRAQPNYWRSYPVDFYLDRRQSEWIEVEAARWVRYLVTDEGAVIQVNSAAAPRVIEALQRPAAARPAAPTTSLDWPPPWRLR